MARHFQVNVAVRSCSDELVDPVGDGFAPFRRFEDVPAGGFFAFNRVRAAKAALANARVYRQCKHFRLRFALRPKVDPEVIVVKLRHAAGPASWVPANAINGHNLDRPASVKPKEPFEIVFVQLFRGCVDRCGADAVEDDVRVRGVQLNPNHVRVDQPALANHFVDQL